ncbi:MAG: 2-dehydro-3-deoxyphosphogluconate aldolase/4-hydroxy-2-oxoglutarate aldolase [Clostridia bacterium]|jgi:2-dehydro-3-deoxyphosphogluconate aldolase/(4S)-4-hydroxy-2-oxoglutarate aldolase|nr:2-dehydro-3-deoxyphosphogluconate aldolase/4-hydroxy-2-oxoglutarate aldolase [Herbinix sp.]MDF2592011.1 2-dehydro-3-deoxyphosphogluconate aldolase/4-hydroxy-2-oxoglutarate aldolase [Clostridia bacterium]
MSEIKYEFAHLGMNHGTPEEAKNTAELLLKLFGFRNYDIGSSIFSSGAFELVKSEYKGTKGHIGIYTSDMELAMEELEGQGVRFDYESLQKKPDGQYVSIYLKDEIAGFAFHLLRKPENTN